MKRRDFLKILKSRDVVPYRHGANHDIFIHIITGKTIPVPRHAEISNLVVKDILKEIPQI